MKIKLQINQEEQLVSCQPGETLLWVLREELQLTGTRFGCLQGVCGACTVLLNGQPVRSCVLPAQACHGQTVTTIEGVGPHPVQEAWIELQVPQCGYCQSGQILCAVALLEQEPDPSEETIATRMVNLCRCGTYPRIRAGILRAAMRLREQAAREEALQPGAAPEEADPKEGAP